MIEYYKGAFNLNLLFQFQGSAVYRAMIPGVIALGVYIWLARSWQNPEPLGHPNAIGTLVGSITLLVVFKANQAYSRNWEAYTAVFAMMSRFQDAIHHMMAYHMQCDHFTTMRPPSYFDHFELNNCFLTRDRESFHELSEQKDVKVARSIRKSINYVHDDAKQKKSQRWDSFQQEIQSEDSERVSDLVEPEQLRTETRLDGGWGKLFPDRKAKRPTATYYHPMMADTLDKKGFASTQGGRTPDLYLQEVVHLTSLLNAVALSTLRNDVDGSESPLAVYNIGSPWPEVDPTNIKSERSWIEHLQRMVGADVTAAARTKYNASRPLTVVGGISDAEIRQLQLARGPYAKTQLAFSWVSEFMIREHKSGSTGTVGDALISRCMQFLGNGMLNYNQARKVMIIPFPFPHAQIAVFFMFVIIPGIPLLMYQYALEQWIGSLLTFLVVTCLAGLHEVSRELENPFRKPPNEVPICTLQAQFNEALLTVYSGYHPDAYFDSTQTRERLSVRSSVSSFMNSTSERSMNSSNGIIIEGDVSQESDNEEDGAENGMEEIHGLRSEIEEHVQEMQRLRRILDEKIKVQQARVAESP